MRAQTTRCHYGTVGCGNTSDTTHECRVRPELVAAHEAAERRAALTAPAPYVPSWTRPAPPAPATPAVAPSATPLEPEPAVRCQNCWHWSTGRLTLGVCAACWRQIEGR